MTDETSVIPELVAAAANGDAAAWRELVDRYSPLLLGVVRSFRLSPSETEDVAQTVWLRAVEHLGSLREPRALPMWLITTGRREALRFLASARRVQPYDPLDPTFPAGTTPAEGDVDGRILFTEMHEALLAGLAELPPRQRDLLRLLLADPPPSYAEITEWTGIPTGSIGPTRARALERLRHTVPVQVYLAERELSTMGGGGTS